MFSAHLFPGDDYSSDEEMDNDISTIPSKRPRGRPPKKETQTPSSAAKQNEDDNGTPGRQLRGQSAKKGKELSTPGDSKTQQDCRQMNDPLIEEEAGNTEMTCSVKRGRGRPPKKLLPSDVKEEKASEVTADSPSITPVRRPRGRPPKADKETPRTARKGWMLKSFLTKLLHHILTEELQIVFFFFMLVIEFLTLNY